ncbi:MAG: serine/threonine-protein kinase [Polyangiaceae bacterium]
MLGRGGMGSVYAAVHLQLGQYVALKVLHGDAARDADSVARFNQEAQVVSRLSSPHVVRVFDMGQTPRGEPFLVMELLQGRDLDAVIAEPRPLQIPEAIRLVLQASIGVATAHAAGLVHRDLKPANLYLARQPDGSEIVKILDFGLTKVMAHGNVGLTQSASSFGTPQYMSPEQIMSAKHVDARCDQHALALILFELLTKRPAYEADTPGAMTVKIVTQKVPSARALRPEVPQKLDEIIQRGMAKKPGDRYANVGAFAQALAPFGFPDARALADLVAQQLRVSSVAVAVDALPPGNSIPSISNNPTQGSFSSGHLWRGRSSSLYWGVGIGVLVAGAAAATLFLVLRNPPAPSAPAAEATHATAPASEPSAQVIVAAPTASASAAEIGAPAASGMPSSAVPSASSSAKPTTTGSRPPTPPGSRVIPPTTAHSAPTPANSQDPFTVFGGHK